ncbi:GNAT family N-acetyltransferase [Latilactobacillus sakei]
MEIRRYQPGDCQAVAELFYKTVHTVNAGDYTKAQLAVWATGEPDLKQWDQSPQSHFSVVALENDNLIGFGDIDQVGYLDRLFVHADYQRRGVATAICHQLEQAVAEPSYHACFDYSQTVFRKSGLSGDSRTTSSTARCFIDQLCYGERAIISRLSHLMMILVNNRFHPCYNEAIIE